MSRLTQVLAAAARILTVGCIVAAAVTVLGLAVLSWRGQQAMVVVSGSMAPAFDAGDAIIVRQVPADDLAVGDVVTFHAFGQREQLTTHRIVSLRQMPEGLFLQTQGDANQTPDSDFTAASSVVGVMGSSLPRVGFWLAFYQSPAGRLLVLGLPLLLLGAAQVRALYRLQRARTRTEMPDHEAAGTGSAGGRRVRRSRRPAAPPFTTAGVLGSTAVILVVSVAAGYLLALPSQARYTGAATVGANTFATRSFCATASTYASVIAADQPSLYYRMGEASGTVAQDASAAPQNGTYTGGVTLGRSGGIACDTSTAAAFDGSTGYLPPGPTAVTNPQVFTVEAWFRTATRGGKIIGFGNARTGASTQYDRHLYLTGTGQLVFGVYTTTHDVIVSPAAYTDGGWHHAAATLGPDGMRLYVDGSQVANNSAVTTAEPFNGFWRVGYDNLTAWVPTPGGEYFRGDIDEVAVYPTALTAARIAAHYAAARP